MPITPSRSAPWRGGEGDSPHPTPLSQVSESRLSLDLEDQSQKSMISKAPSEHALCTPRHSQAEPSLEEFQSSQKPQSLQDSFYIFDTESACSTYSPGYLDESMCPSLSFGGTSEPISDIPEGIENHAPGTAGICIPLSPDFKISLISREQEETGHISGLPYNEFSWNEIGPEFDTSCRPETISASVHRPLHRGDQSKQKIPSSASNASDTVGESPEPPLIDKSPHSLAGISIKGKLVGKGPCQLNMDDMEPLMRGCTGRSSLSNSTSWSTDESITSSDYEDDIASVPSDPLFEPLREPLLQYLLSAWGRLAREAKKANDGDAPDTAASTASSKQTATSLTQACTSSPTKRKRQHLSQNSGNGEDEDEDEDGEGPPQRKRVEQLRDEGLLACPFAKWKPLSYQCCYKYIMKDIRRVKQHLRRSHKRPLHCPTCWETFKSEKAFYTQIGSRECLPRPATVMEGVTSDQQEHLDRKVDRKLSRSEQWYSVFAILFPDSPRPRSAYLESDLSAELLDFQKFMATDGLRIVEQTVHEQIPPSLIPQTEEIVMFSQVLFQQAIPEILKKYEAVRPHNSSPESGYESLFPPSSSQLVPDGHRLDERARVESIHETNNPILQDSSMADIPDHLFSFENPSIPEPLDLDLEDFLATL
ncbi:hypothetical protein F4808DRAFT_463423 [Astrocystis sublimbata]|nr:hypothetical protein F4808DRAFT_463423 [Astrocystis sublimbata]